jgi:iron complex transport system substrate-binding protein
VRIVSLLPSATDIVCTLGLRDHLVGRTHECDWPPGIEEVPAVTSDVLATHELSSADIHAAIGGAVHSGSSIYGLDTEALARARPDLIITQELCEVCAVSYMDVERAARMMDAGTRIVSLEPHSIDDILAHVELIGRLTGTEDRARSVVSEARARLDRLRAASRDLPHPGVVCIEWLDPIFVGGHWVPEQVEAAGGVDLLGPRGEPSHVVAWDDVLDAAPDAIVLMPCGMAIERTLGELGAVTSRPGWDDLPAVRAGRVFVVDASSYFNRPGPRVVRGAEILFGLLHLEAAGVTEPPTAQEALHIETA